MNKSGLFFLVILSGILLSVNSYLPDNIKYIQEDSVVTASVAVVGDLMCHSVQYNYARKGIDTFDFSPVYRYVKEIISSADLAFANFETVTAGREKGYSGYPFFNTPDDFIPALTGAGFDLFTTSNNHSLDQGENGLRRTINNITLNGAGYNGTFLDQRDRDSVRIYNVNGISIAFLAYSYGTNGLPVPKGKSYLINLIDTVLIKNDIRNAKLLGPDIILVHYHFGEKYKRKPSAIQQDIVKRTIEYGADIIIGGHPHVIQPAEFIGINNSDTAFVIYSMGNFISNQRKRYTDAGVILQLNFTKNLTSGKTNLINVLFTPTWVFKGSTGSGNEYIILPYGNNSSDIKLNQEDSIKMNQAFNDTRNMLLTDKRILLR